uniref:Uncharacterized protein n=1 Tax=Myoviridae sp. ctoNH1 TaxID=2826695 RepID=A0A8S5QT74_9CAUD|nr:MAG TPA: hypothetical protein [Myoviridae sp. ctoNH1]
MQEAQDDLLPVAAGQRGDTKRDRPAGDRNRELSVLRQTPLGDIQAAQYLQACRQRLCTLPCQRGKRVEHAVNA